MKGVIFSLLLIFTVFCGTFGALSQGDLLKTLSPTEFSARSSNPGVVHLSWKSSIGKCEDFGTLFSHFSFSIPSKNLELKCESTSFISTSTRCFAPDSISATISIQLHCLEVNVSSPIVESQAPVWFYSYSSGSPSDLTATSFGTDSVFLSWKLDAPTCEQAGSTFVEWLFSADVSDLQTRLYHVETQESARNTKFPGLFPLTSYQIVLTQICADPTKSSQSKALLLDTPALVQSLSPSAVFAGGFDTEVFIHGNSTVVDVAVEGVLACQYAGSERIGYSIEYTNLDEFGFTTTWHPMNCKLDHVSLPVDNPEVFDESNISQLGLAFFNCTVEHDTDYKIRASVLCSDPLKSSNHTASNAFRSLKDFRSAATIDLLHQNEAVLSSSIKVSVNQNTFANENSVTGLTFLPLTGETKRKRGLAVFPIPSEAVDFGSMNFELNGVTPNGPLGSDFTQNPLVLEIHYKDYGFTDDQADQFALYFLNSTTLRYQNVKDTCPPQFHISRVDLTTKTWTVYICHLTEFRGFLVPSQVVPPTPTSSSAPQPSEEVPSESVSTAAGGGFNAIGADGVYYRNGWDRKTVAIAVVISILGTILLVILVLLLIFILMRKRREDPQEEEEPEVQMPRENVVLVYKSFIPVHNDDVLALSPKGVVGELELRLDLGENDSSNDSHTESTSDSDSDNSESDGSDESDFSKDNKSTDKGVAIVADMSAFGGFGKNTSNPATSTISSIDPPSKSAPAPSTSSPVVVPILATQEEESEEEKSDEKSEEKSESDSGSDDSSDGSDSSESSDSEDSDDSESLKPQNA